MGNSDSSTSKRNCGDVWNRESRIESPLLVKSSVSGDSSLSGTMKRPLPYRRYYPMSQQKNDDFFRSCPLLEANSPLRKRLRIGEDSFSLPAALCEPDPHLPGPKLLPSLGDSYSSEVPKAVTFDEQRQQRDQRPQSCCDFLESEEQFVTCRTELDFSTKPITSAVISKGLKAKFKSFSAWLLHEHPGQVSNYCVKILTTSNKYISVT